MRLIKISILPITNGVNECKAVWNQPILSTPPHCHPVTQYFWPCSHRSRDRTGRDGFRYPVQSRKQTNQQPTV